MFQTVGQSFYTYLVNHGVPMDDAIEIAVALTRTLHRN